MNLDIIYNERINFVRDFLNKVCNFDVDIVEDLVSKFNKIDSNIYSSIYLNDNEKYQVLIKFMEQSININSKLTRSYLYDDNEEWIKEEYIDERSDQFVIDQPYLHHIYNKKQIVSLIPEFGATREGIKEYNNSDFYEISSNYSFEDGIDFFKLQKIKK